jgi:hypothetical protein
MRCTDRVTGKNLGEDSIRTATKHNTNLSGLCSEHITALQLHLELIQGRISRFCLILCLSRTTNTRPPSACAEMTQYSFNKGPIIIHGTFLTSSDRVCPVAPLLDAQKWRSSPELEMHYLPALDPDSDDSSARFCGLFSSEGVTLYRESLLFWKRQLHFELHPRLR